MQEQRKMKSKIEIKILKKNSTKSGIKTINTYSKVINTYSKGKLVKATRFSKIVYFLTTAYFYYNTL